MEANGQAFPPPPATAAAAAAPGTNEQPRQMSRRRRNHSNPTNRNNSGSGGNSRGSNLRTSHVYCLVSLAVAVLAVITATAPPLLWPLVHVGVGGSKNSQLSPNTGTGMADIASLSSDDSNNNNGNGGNKQFHPPASYSDLFRPFTDFFSRGNGNGNGNGNDGIGASLLGDWEGMLGLLSGGGERNGKEAADDAAGDLRDTSEATATMEHDDNGSDNNVPSASFFFLPQKLLLPGLKWLVGSNIPSSHNNEADQGKKKDVGRSKQHDRGNAGKDKDKSKSKTKHDDATCNGNGGDDSCQTKHQDTKRSIRQRKKLTPRRIFHSFLRTVGAMIDPSIRRLPTEPAGSFTKVVDKVLTSTPRLLAIANLLLAATYLLHGAVAEFFLGQAGGGAGRGGGGGGRNRNRGGAGQQGQGAVILQANAGSRQQGQAPPTETAQAPTAPAGAGVPPMPPTRLNRSNRERLGGYLLFKLLLVSAVVEPDTLDLLILLSWYTLLSFLRSLAHLAGTATSHAAQSGSPPMPGVLRLLVVVLLSDFCAAALCAGLFSGAGWGTVLLLSCDCALLAVDTLAHIARHVGQMFEEKHSAAVGALEIEQLRLGEEARTFTSSSSSPGDNRHRNGGRNDLRDNEASTETNAGADTSAVESVHVADDPTDTRDQAHRQSRRIDRQIELLESLHCRRLSILDSVVFSLELAAYLLTICHFLHIWR